MKNKKQISNKGIAQRSGLEVLSSITTHNGEYVNFGNALAYGLQLGSDTDYSTTATNPQTDALANSPASVIGRWYRYHSSGSPHTATSAPASVGGNYVFYGQKTGGNASYSGIYQQLSINRGSEYRISVQTAISASAGTMYVETYSKEDITTGSVFNHVLRSSSTITFPVTNNSTGIIESTFTAATNNDILLIYFTTDSTASINVGITNIAIQEKQEYLIPTYGTDNFGDAHKILRRSYGQDPQRNIND